MVTVETLDKLERRITLTLPAEPIRNEVAARLKKLARTIKADGFRPGKVPLSFVTQRYADSVQYEVMSDKVGEAFSDAVSQAKLRIAGPPRISEKSSETLDGHFAFDAFFEVFPEIKMGNLEDIAIERVTSTLTEATLDKTIDVLRKQRRTFQRRPSSEGACEGDRVTIDFEGKIDGVPFEGGQAKEFQFLIGEGQMLEAFDKSVRGMKEGDSKTFPMEFPADYQSKDVAGKEADFLVTLTKLEEQILPAMDDTFADSLGVGTSTVEMLRENVKKNLEREIKLRIQQQNKKFVMDALLKLAELEVPKTLVSAEMERMVEAARTELKSRGSSDANSEIPAEFFRSQAERRVRLSLIVRELVLTHQLQAKPDQLRAHLEEMAQSYENPAEVVRWYLSDTDRMAEVGSLVVENNLAEFVLSSAKVVEKELPFDELMAA